MYSAILGDQVKLQNRQDGTAVLATSNIHVKPRVCHPLFMILFEPHSDTVTLE